MQSVLKKIAVFALALAVIAAFGCKGDTPPTQTDEQGMQTTNPPGQTAPKEAEAPDIGEAVASLFGSIENIEKYDGENAVRITLSDSGTDCASDAVTTEEGKVRITQAGTYIISGRLADGVLTVNAGDSDRVVLVLDGAEISSAADSAVKLKNAGSVVIILPNGTTNAICSTAQAETDADTHAAMSVHTGLIIAGSGALEISSASGNGIKADGAMLITSGEYRLSAAKHGIKAAELYILGGSFEIESELDGIHVDGKDTELSGSLGIAEGSYKISANGDGISAAGDVRLLGGSYAVTTGEGSASVTLKSDGGMGGMPWGQFDGSSDDGDTSSQKGIKAGGSITIMGGSYDIDTVDDCLHAGGNISIADGEFNELRTGDDAVSAVGSLVIESGSFVIPYCYEGLEATSVTIRSGSIDIISSDDGINAADDDDDSRDPFKASTDNFVIIDSGSLTIVSEGDCIDSNGDIIVNGGTLRLTCGGNGNTAIDASGSFTNNGGDVTTNDGSESGNMGGGMGGGKPGGPGGGKPGGPGRP